MGLARKRFGTIGIGAIALALAAGMLAGCGGEGGETAGGSVENEGAIRVAAVRAAAGDLRRVVRQPGQVVPLEKATLTSRVAGIVEKVRVDIGSLASKGQTLVELSAPERVAEAARARAEVERARAELALAEAGATVAETGVAAAQARREALAASARAARADLSRWESESARVAQLVGSGAVTASFGDETRNKLETARARAEQGDSELLAAEAGIDEARAALGQAIARVRAAEAFARVAEEESRRAEAMVDYLNVRAPFDGIVTHRAVDPGHRTRDGEAGGTPLLTLIRIDGVTATTGVPEREIGRVGVGKPAIVRVPSSGAGSGSDDGIRAKVSRTSWAAEPTTRTLTVEIDLTDAEAGTDRRPRPGQYVEIEIVTDAREGVLNLPNSAIVGEGERRHCYVIANDVLKRTAVRVGLDDGKRTEISEGLRAGDVVVEKPTELLRDGQAAIAILPED